MEIDVFTLFPDAFAWFERQRHVVNATGCGNRLGYVNYRDHTPLSAGQVDDTPFGGGAGMVLRVDVVEAALRARYGRDPVTLRAAAAGHRARRRRAGARRRHWSTSSPREPALTLLSRPLRGLRSARRSITSPPTRCRSAATCSPAASWRRWSCATRCCASSGRARVMPTRRSRSLSARRSRGAPEYPHYTRPAEYRGWPCPMCSCRATTRGSGSGGLRRARLAREHRTHGPRRRRRSATIGRPGQAHCVAKSGPAA